MQATSRPGPCIPAIPRAALSLALLAALLSAPISAQRVPDPTDLRLDHFRCYTVWQPPSASTVPPEVLLQDQFDRRLGRTELVSLGLPDRFCNPVAKEVDIPGGGGGLTEITDPNAHLTMYEIRELDASVPSFFWRVLVGNQFGRQQLSVREPVQLAVPTWKVEAGLTFPENLDHFKCYKARGKPLGLVAGLEDQFETQKLLVLDPQLFCNPVQKTGIDGTVLARIQNPDAHLTCYDISIPAGNFGFSALLFIGFFNQFTGDTLELGVVTDEDLLCVPSVKLRVFGAAGSLKAP